MRQNILRTIDSTDADVVALQETPANWFGELADYFDSRGYNISFLYNPDLFGIEGMTTAWKKSKLDKAPVVTHSSFEKTKGRPITVLDFGDMVFVNLHAGHDYRVGRFVRQLSQWRNRSNVIIAGDFNRDLRVLRLGKGLLSVYNCSLFSLDTCCSTSVNGKHNYPYDHVFTDMTVKQPTTIVSKVFPASDHLPILASILLPPSA